MKIIKVGSTKLTGYELPKEPSKKTKRRKAKEERGAEKESKRQRAARRQETKKWKAHKEQKTAEAKATYYRTQDLNKQMDLAIDKDD